MSSARARPHMGSQRVVGLRTLEVREVHDYHAPPAAFLDLLPDLVKASVGPAQERHVCV